MPASPSRWHSCSWTARPAERETALALTDLAAIGSVADVVPIVGENRSIVRLGLARLAAAPRPGLAALMASARIEREGVSTDDISFGLAPRINAMGRIGDPRIAAELLLADDAATAERLAAELEAANRRPAHPDRRGHGRGT